MRDYRQNPGVVQRVNAAWERAGLTGPQKAVLVVLTWHSDNDLICWPGIDRLSDMTSLGRSTVQRALKDLEAARVIRVRRSRGHASNVYFLDTIARMLQLPIPKDPFGRRPHNRAPINNVVSIGRQIPF